MLSQFTGSEHWYRGCINRRVLFTDGAKHVADSGGAYWLLDEIALAQLHVKAVAAERFQVWTLKADIVRHTGTLTCEDGNGNTVFDKGARIYRLPDPRNHPLVHRQHDLPAERILTKTGPPAGAAPFFIHHQPTGV